VLLTVEAEQEALRSLENAFNDATSESELQTPSQRRATSKAESLNKSAQLLYRILAILDPSETDSSPLATLDASSFDLIFNETKNTINQIIERQENTAPTKGVLATVGKGIEKLCSCTGPFIKVFLTVGVRGSAVLSHVSQLMSIPILNPYGLLCSGLSLLITVLPPPCPS
jgi:hypothetical protein